MEEKEFIEGYQLDEEGYHVADEIFKGKLLLKKCGECGTYLDFVYQEKYLYFKEVGTLMIMGLKVLGLECKNCNCGFIYKGEEEGLA